MGDFVLIAVMVACFIGVLVFKKNQNQKVAKVGVGVSTLLLVGCLGYMILNLDGNKDKDISAHQSALQQTNYAVGKKAADIMQGNNLSNATVFIINYSDKQDDYKYGEIANGIKAVNPSSEVKFETIRPLKLNQQGEIIPIIEDDLTADEISAAIAGVNPDELIISTIAIPDSVWRNIGKRKVLFLNQQFVASNSNVFRQGWCIGGFVPKRQAPKANEMIPDNSQVFDLRYDFVDKNNYKETIGQ
ncbi:MAG: hypothetical protein MST10_07135 [Lentisphaeria bacterium]|nr:hypothetical protein [Lentisphaeria bacterium]